MSALTDFYDNVVDAIACLESAKVALLDLPINDDWQAMKELEHNIKEALKILQIPDEVSQVVFAEEAQLGGAAQVAPERIANENL